MKQLVICQGSGDGLISAAAIIQGLGLGLKQSLEIIITNEVLLDKLKIGEDVNQIFVIGLTMDKNNLSATEKFAQINAKNIVMWIYPDNSGNTLLSILKQKFISSTWAPSTAEVVNSVICPISKIWLEAANAINKPDNFPLTPLAKRYNQALKIVSTEASDEKERILEKFQRTFIYELLYDKETQLISEYASRCDQNV